MLCDLLSHYCLAFIMFHGTRTNEDMKEFQKYTLAHTTIMKLPKMNYISKDYYLFMNNF